MRPDEDLPDPADEEEGEDGEEATPEDADAEAQDAAVTVDPDGIMDRIVAAPGLPPRSYGGLAPGPEGHVFVLENVPNEPSSTLHNLSRSSRSGWGLTRT